MVDDQPLPNRLITISGQLIDTLVVNYVPLMIRLSSQIGKKSIHSAPKFTLADASKLVNKYCRFSFSDNLSPVLSKQTRS